MKNTLAFCHEIFSGHYFNKDISYHLKSLCKPSLGSKPNGLLQESYKDSLIPAMSSQTFIQDNNSPVKNLLFCWVSARDKAFGSRMHNC